MTAQKAARSGRPRATASIKRQSNYPPRRPASTPTGTFFRRPDDATAADPGLQRGDAETVEATGFLVLYLLSRPLPKPERALGWSLVEEWLAEVAQSRHVEHLGAA